MVGSWDVVMGFDVNVCGNVGVVVVVVGYTHVGSVVCVCETVLAYGKAGVRVHVCVVIIVGIVVVITQIVVSVVVGDAEDVA